MMAKTLKLAAAQSQTLSSTSATLLALRETTVRAAALGVDLILFPEAYLGGYPRTCNFGCSIGARAPEGRDQFLHYFRSAVDLGDTPDGADDAWLRRELPVAKGEKYRGDGTREELESIARDTGVFLATGLIERSGGTLYCAVVYVCPHTGTLGKRRKVMPTGTERLVWGQGQAKTLKAVCTVIKGVKITLAAAICWENLMPLLRQSLYAQNVNLYLAPTADTRPTWAPLVQTIGNEGRCFVISANQCQRRKDLPEWITGTISGNRKSVENSIAPLNGDQGSMRRRSSIVTTTKDGHEINWPNPSQPSGYSETVSSTLVANKMPTGGKIASEKMGIPKGVVNGATSREQMTRRRSSVVTKTKEGHEINWPCSSHALSEEALIDEQTHSEDSMLPKARTGSEFKTPDAVAHMPTEHDPEEFVSRGGSCIVSPIGELMQGPLWEVDDELVIADADFEDCERGRLDLDVAGSYSRMDSFKLEVAGLDLAPPP